MAKTMITTMRSGSPFSHAFGAAALSLRRSRSQGDADWRLANTAAHRETMCRNVAKILLEKRGRKATPEWKQRLPYIAQRVESGLFKNASSLADYLRPETLTERVRVEAVQLVQSASKNVEKGTWRESCTQSDRRRMQFIIFQLLKERNTAASAEMVAKMAKAAKRWEHMLFNRATSLENYKSTDDLRSRLPEFAEIAGPQP